MNAEAALSVTTGHLEVGQRWWRIASSAAALAGAMLSLPAHCAGSLTDPFDVDAIPSRTPARSAVSSAGGPADCELGVPAGALTLLVAAEHALCRNPKTRSAWVDVKLKAAQWGGSQAAFGPKVDVTLQSSAEKSHTRVEQQPSLSSDQRMTFRDYSLALSWKLIDFGARQAEAEAARQLLEASQFAQDDAIQKVLSTLVKDYYAAAAARTALEVATSTADDAKRSLEAANARFARGVASVIDRLQAETEYAQAVFDLTKAAGEAKESNGVLAVDMGWPPTLTLDLPALSDRQVTEPVSDEAIDTVIAEAKLHHPRTAQARAELLAAMSRVNATRAQGRPSLTLNGHASNSTRPVVPAVGLPPLVASGRDRFIGFQVDIPLFEGYTRTYDLRAAQAAVESEQVNLADAEQQVALGSWSAHVSLQTAEESLRNAGKALEAAQQTYAAATQRYGKGVGSMMELLSAQTALSHARQRQVQALADWRSARLQLAAALGRLSLLGLQ